MLRQVPHTQFLLARAPLELHHHAGQISDYTGAAALLDAMPKAWRLLGEWGQDDDWFRQALQASGIQPAFRGGGRAMRRSDTTNGAMGVVTASGLCSAA